MAEEYNPFEQKPEQPLGYGEMDTGEDGFLFAVMVGNIDFHSMFFHNHWLLYGGDRRRVTAVPGSI